MDILDAEQVEDVLLAAHRILYAPRHSLDRLSVDSLPDNSIEAVVRERQIPQPRELAHRAVKVVGAGHMQQGEGIASPRVRLDVETPPRAARRPLDET